MSVLYLALPIALLLVAVAFWAFRWCVNSGQLDDLETPAHRAIFDDKPTREPADHIKSMTNTN